MNFLDFISSNIVIGDGAMGTMLQKYGVLKPKIAPESLNITNPEIIKQIHTKYIEAGSNLIETNTFGANRIKLSNYNLSNKIKEINKAAVYLAKQAIKDKQNIFIAGSIGPSGELVKDEGKLTIKNAITLYKEQADILCKAGVDVLLFETFSDLTELKCAIIGAREITDIPIIAQLTYDESGHTLTGSTPEAATVTLEACGVNIIGVNCSLGPKELINIVNRIYNVTSLPISVFPNAGLPYLENGKTIFPETPESFSSYAEKFIAAGAVIIGGCCGTTYEHIKLLSKKLKGKRIKKRNKLSCSFIASRSKVFAFNNSNLPPILIGERLNPTGRKKLSQDIKDNKFILYRQDAIKQENAGAHALDINVSVPGIDELPFMIEAIKTVQGSTGCALCIDSSNPHVLSKALPYVDGKPIINSINGKKESMEILMPVIKKWGTMAIVLLLDENGIPDNTKDRIKIAEKILNFAEAFNIPKDRFLFDALTLTIGSNPESAKTALETLKLLKELDLYSNMGVSNVSFGLPGRTLLTSAFLSQVIANGVSSVIINPLKPEIISSFAASCALMNRDPDFKLFYSIADKMKKLKLIQKNIIDTSTIDKKNNDNLTTNENKLKNAVINGAKKEALLYLKELIKEKKTLDILNNILIPAMLIVGEKYDKREFFLPQLIKAAETMKECSNFLSSYLPKKENKEKDGIILLATVEGDIHDIGKNLVANLLINHGFEVMDLGKDVKSDIILGKIKENPRIKIVGLSALMTTTMIKMKEIIEKLKKNNLRKRVKIIVGGAVINDEFSKKIGADFYAEDAISGVRIAEKILKKN